MLKVPATITKVETMSDRSLKLTVRTQEILPSDKAEVMELDQQLGYFVFSVADVIEEKDIPTDPITEFPEEKSSSQRLRAALYVYWEQLAAKSPNTKKIGFELFYRENMEKFIEFVKNKLD